MLPDPIHKAIHAVAVRGLFLQSPEPRCGLRPSTQILGLLNQMLSHSQHSWTGALEARWRAAGLRNSVASGQEPPTGERGRSQSLLCIEDSGGSLGGGFEGRVYT